MGQVRRLGSAETVNASLSECHGSSRELESLGFRFEPRPKYRSVERVLKAIVDERIIVASTYMFADARHEEVHGLAVIGKLPTRQHNLMRALLVELAQLCSGGKDGKRRGSVRV